MSVLVGVVLLRSDLLAPRLRIIGLVLAPPFVLGPVALVGRSSPGAWKPAGRWLHIGWSRWLLALGEWLLVTA